MSALTTLFPVSERATATFVRKGLRELLKDINKQSDKAQMSKGVVDSYWGRPVPKFKSNILQPLEEAATARAGNPSDLMSEAVSTGRLNGIPLSSNQRRQLAIQHQALQDVISNKPWIVDKVNEPFSNTLDDLYRAVNNNASTMDDPLFNLTREQNYGKIMGMLPYTWNKKSLETLSTNLNKKLKLNEPTLFENLNEDKETIAKGLARAKILEKLFNNNQRVVYENNISPYPQQLNAALWRKGREFDTIKRKAHNLPDYPWVHSIDNLNRQMGDTPETRRIIKELAPLWDKFPGRSKGYTPETFLSEASKLDQSQLDTLKVLMQDWSGTIPELFATVKLI